MITINREQEVAFTNFTDEDFDGKWNKKIYRLKAKRSYYLAFYLAEHFAKHLVDKELNKKANEEIKKIRKIDHRIDAKEIERREQSILSNLTLRQELMDKCVQKTELEQGDLDIISPREIPQEEIILKTNERSQEMVDSGKVSPDALGSYNKPKKRKEEEFEGK